MNRNNESHFACPVCLKHNQTVALWQFWDAWRCPVGDCRSQFELVRYLDGNGALVGLVNSQWAKTFNWAVREFVEQNGTALTLEMVEAGTKAVKDIPRITELFKLTEIPRIAVSRHYLPVHPGMGVNHMGEQPANVTRTGLTRAKL